MNFLGSKTLAHLTRHLSLVSRFGKTRLGIVSRLGDQVRKSRLVDTIDDQGGYRMEIGRSEVREEQNKD
jgi:hypothetical protein